MVDGSIGLSLPACGDSGALGNAPKVAVSPEDYRIRNEEDRRLALNPPHD
jgi:hypothetical protein